MKFAKASITLSLAATIILSGCAAPTTNNESRDASTVSVTPSPVISPSATQSKTTQAADKTVASKKTEAPKPSESVVKPTPSKPAPEKVVTKSLAPKPTPKAVVPKKDVAKPSPTKTSKKNVESKVSAPAKLSSKKSTKKDEVKKSAPKKEAPKKAAPKKVAPKKTNSSKRISIRSVKTYGDAQLYLKQNCPRVKIKKISGNVSHYNPNTSTIAIAQAHTKSYRMGFVFAHELSHHYQYFGYYNNSGDQWGKDIRNKKIEKQADQMAYFLYGGIGQGVYNKKKATGTALTNVKSMIYKGKANGC